MYHLTLADAITCFITLPMETVWRATIQWHAGNAACKVLMMVRTGGFILSSNMLVVLSIDRFIRHHIALNTLLQSSVRTRLSACGGCDVRVSVSRPLSSINTVRQRRRARLMVITAWLLTVISASPQAVIFRVLKHPDTEFYQCTTVNYFESWATNVTIGNKTELRLELILAVGLSKQIRILFLWRRDCSLV